MHPTAQKFTEVARAFGLDTVVRESASSSRTAEEAAKAVGCDVAQIVKSLLFIVNDQPTMVLVSGRNRLDEKKLASLCGVDRKRIKRSNAETARAVTGYAIGGVPPFGHDTKLPTYVDEDLEQFDILWAAAGTPHAVFAIAPQDLVRVTDGSVADLKADT